MWTIVIRMDCGSAYFSGKIGVKAIDCHITHKSRVNIEIGLINVLYLCLSEFKI